jgi:hypothetical protein
VWSKPRSRMGPSCLRSTRLLPLWLGRRERASTLPSSQGRGQPVLLRRRLLPHRRLHDFYPIRRLTLQQPLWLHLLLQPPQLSYRASPPLPWPRTPRQRMQLLRLSFQPLPCFIRRPHRLLPAH